MWKRTLHFVLSRTQRDWLLLALFAASLWAGHAFAEVAGDVHEGDMRAADLAVRAWFLSHQSPLAGAFLETISGLGSKNVLFVFALGLGWLLARNWTFMIVIVLCGIIAATSVDLLKEGFAITRPATGMLERKSFSFPSGHVSGTAALSVLLGFMALRRKRWRVVTCVSGGLMTVLMAISRMYLDMHWLSDVIGGVLVGASLGLGFSALYVLIRHQMERRAKRISLRGAAPELSRSRSR